MNPSVDDVDLPAPPQVIAAVALGVAPLPFLAVYAVLFLVHGTVHPVIPPDIGSSQHDELIAGLVAAAVFVVGIVSLFGFIGGRRRWPFLVVQLATLATSIGFVLDPRTGSPAVPLLLLVTSLAAVVLALLPASWRWMAPAMPERLRRRVHRLL